MKRIWDEIKVIGAIAIGGAVLMFLWWGASLLSPQMILSWLGSNWVGLIVGAIAHAVVTAFINRKK